MINISIDDDGNVSINGSKIPHNYPHKEDEPEPTIGTVIWWTKYGCNWGRFFMRTNKGWQFFSDWVPQHYGDAGDIYPCAWNDLRFRRRRQTKYWDAPQVAMRGES